MAIKKVFIDKEENEISFIIDENYKLILEISLPNDGSRIARNIVLDTNEASEFIKELYKNRKKL